MSTVGNGISFENPLDPWADSSLAMSEKERIERTEKFEPDWDELKLWRGEVGPNVADEFASK